MAMHDITSLVDILRAAGWTDARIKSIHPRISISGVCYAGNRQAQDAIGRVVERIEAAARPAAAPASPTAPAATPAQIAYIARLGGTAPDGLTKSAASRLIDRLKSDPAAVALAIGRGYGVNGEIWDNA